jgi:adenosylhomocysteine nucleosidase
MLGIIGAMDVELKLLYKNMVDVDITTVSGFEFRKGILHGKSVVITCCGVGKVNAAACTQTLIQTYGVKHIVNTGIAGGLRPEVKIGDVEGNVFRR